MSYFATPARGQLWAEMRNIDSANYRTVRWFVLVDVDDDQVVTADVDHAAWDWRPALDGWGVGDSPVVLHGPFGRMPTAALRHKNFVQLADPKHVACVFPAEMPLQMMLDPFKGPP